MNQSRKPVNEIAPSQFGKAIVLAFIAGALCAGTTLAEPRQSLCKPLAAAHSSYFTVEGQLSPYQGTPSWRIWRLGTKRILGVLDYTGAEAEEREKIIPDKAWALLIKDPDRLAVRGTYTLCPLTPMKPDGMQMVCIRRATNLSQVTLTYRPSSSK